MCVILVRDIAGVNNSSNADAVRCEARREQAHPSDCPTSDATAIFAGQ